MHLRDVARVASLTSLITKLDKAMASERVLSIVEATRLIYRTRTPTDQQIHRIYEQMKAGLLRTHQRGGSPLRWTTTEDALAEFLGTKVGPTLTTNDLKAFGIERLRELKSKYFPPNHVDEFKNYSLNGFIEEQGRPSVDDKGRDSKTPSAGGDEFDGYSLNQFLDGAD